MVRNHQVKIPLKQHKWKVDDPLKQQYMAVSEDCTNFSQQKQSMYCLSKQVTFPWFLTLETARSKNLRLRKRPGFCIRFSGNNVPLSLVLLIYMLHFEPSRRTLQSGCNRVWPRFFVFKKKTSIDPNARITAQQSWL